MRTISNRAKAGTLGGSPVSFYIYMEDVDAAFKVAVDAGAEVEMAVQEMFWGDRKGAEEAAVQIKQQ